MNMESGQVIESGSADGRGPGAGAVMSDKLEPGARVPRALIDSLLKSGSQALSTVPDSVRMKAAELLSQEKLPDESAELWRQTSLELFPFEALGTASAVVETAPSVLSAASAQASGAPSPGAVVSGGQLPDGVEWIPCAALSPEDIKAMLPVFNDACTEVQHDAVSRLLLLSSRGGGFLRVRAGKKVTEPIRLSLILPSLIPQSQVLLVAPTVGVLVERGASCVLLEDLSSKSGQSLNEGGSPAPQAHVDTRMMVAPRLDVLIGENAQAELLSVQRLPVQCAYLGRHRFQLKRDAQLHTTHVALGAGVSRLELECSLLDSGARADLYSLYIADGERHVDFHTTQAHRAPHCYSNLYCKGAVTDAARSVYYGFIRVAEGAQKTDAYQKNRNLLLSEDARADAIPNLEILANDVKCSHGASVGQVGADELFYLMSRGISRTEAEQMLVQAFFEDVVAKVENPFAREYVEQVVSSAFIAMAEKRQGGK